MSQNNSFSSRENEVVNLVLEGKSNKMIAAVLNITESTVEFHLKNIYTKMQVSSRTELIIKLGKSTVAQSDKNSENGDRPGRNWWVSLRDTVSRIGKDLRMRSTMISNAHSGGAPMTFFESILVCFTKYADFTGKASRSELGWFVLFVLLAGSALTEINEVSGSVFFIAVLLPFLAVGARRLHDIDKSGWWLLYMLIPVAGFILVGILWAQPPTTLRPEDPPAE